MAGKTLAPAVGFEYVIRVPSNLDIVFAQLKGLADTAAHSTAEASTLAVAPQEDPAIAAFERRLMPPAPIGKGHRVLPPVYVGTEYEQVGAINDYFDLHGLPPIAWDCLLLPKHKVPGTVAIPHASLIPGMAYTVAECILPIEETMGRKLELRGYRPPAYNRAVGGAKRSRHIWAHAFDVRLRRGQSETKEEWANARRKLAEVTVGFWLDYGRELNMGVGVYGTKRQPNHVHIDAGWRSRLWKHAPAMARRMRGAR